MNTSYTKAEHAQLQEQVARCIRRMMQPDAAAWENTGMVPRAVLHRMGRAGLPGLAVSAGDGGGAIKVMLEEVAKRY